MANQVLYGGFRRLKKFALDPTSTFKTFDELTTYLERDKTAYPGQAIVVWGDKIESNNGSYIVKEIPATVPGQAPVLELEKHLSYEETKVKLKIEITDALEQDLIDAQNNIKVVSEALGISVGPDGNPTQPTSNSVVKRLEKIEELLELNDENHLSDAIKDLELLIQGIQQDMGEGGALKDKFASKEEFDTLKDLVNSLDDGDPDTLLQDYMTTFEKINKELDKVYTFLAGGQSAFDQLLINSNHLSNVIHNQIFSLTEDNLPAGIVNKITSVSSELRGLISGLQTSVGNIETTLTNLDEDIKKRVLQSDYDKFVTSTKTAVEKVGENIRRSMCIDFNDGKAAASLPKNITVTAVRFIVDVPSSNDNIKCKITLNNEVIIDPDEDDVYFDERIEVVTEKTVAIGAQSAHVEIQGMKGGVNSGSLEGAIGRVYIEYTENSNKYFEN